MKHLSTLAEAVAWLRQHCRGDLQTDSRQVQAGDAFIAWPGAASDGRRFVPAVLAQGAGACLVERQGLEAHAWVGAVDEAAPLASFSGLKAAAGTLAAAYYGEPSAGLDVVAITGTNGKTSTAWWLAQALDSLDWPCAMVGTLGIGRLSQVQYTGLTTPDPVLMQRHFRQFVDQGLKACAIEASSIGIAERRLDGTQVKVAVFTNFTQDHLDYHGSMEAYWQAKRMLFDWPSIQAAVINLDDAQGAALAHALSQRRMASWTVSRQGAAQLQARDVGYRAEGLHFTVVEGGQAHALQTRLIGDYNVSNLLGVIGAMRALDVPLADAVQACRHLQPVPGRMACLSEPGQPLVAVDYAHTPDALEQALLALRSLARQRGGRLWCVFGCGGDRDPVKRPLMGAVAERMADRVVLTSDNPRSEAPEAILAQIAQGLRQPARALQALDRAQAIAQALALADAADVVLLAGKGHEDYQETAGVRRPFSDMEQARAALARRGGAPFGGAGVAQ